MRKIVFFVLLICSAVSAQNRRGPAVLFEVSNKSVVQSVFPEAKQVEKIDDYWYRVTDDSKKTIGFALSSMDHCKDVKGYNGATPVLIVTDKKHVIKKVALKSNYETQSFVNILVNSGFFNSWNGKSIKTASSATVDGTTGATFTANGVKKNVAFLLENGVKNMPKK
jgi:hypothetical protein